MFQVQSIVPRLMSNNLVVVNTFQPENITDMSDKEVLSEVKIL